MTRSNTEKANKFATFGERYEKAQIAAARRTSKKFGRIIVKQRLAQLGDVSPRRQKGVTHKVTKRGSLVLLDMAPMSVPQEYGATLTPESGQYMRIAVGKKRGLDPNAKRFVVKGKSGELILMEKKGDRAEAVAVLKAQVVVQRAPAGRRFATLVDKNQRAYVAEMAEQIIKELDK